MRSLRRCDEKIISENIVRARRHSHYFAWPVSDGRIRFLYEFLSGSVVYEIRFACALLHRFNFHRGWNSVFLCTRECLALCGLQGDSEALADRIPDVSSHSFGALNIRVPNFDSSKHSPKKQLRNYSFLGNLRISH